MSVMTGLAGPRIWKPHCVVRAPSRLVKATAACCIVSYVQSLQPGCGPVIQSSLGTGTPPWSNIVLLMITQG